MSVALAMIALAEMAAVVAAVMSTGSVVLMTMATTMAAMLDFGACAPATNHTKSCIFHFFDFGIKSMRHLIFLTGATLRAGRMLF